MSGETVALSKLAGKLPEKDLSLFTGDELSTKMPEQKDNFYRCLLLFSNTTNNLTY